MQNRPHVTHEEMSVLQLEQHHQEAHLIESMVNMIPSVSSDIVMMQVAAAMHLEQIHELQDDRADELENDLFYKQDADKNVAESVKRDEYASKLGMFSPAIVARRAEVEAMLNASAEAALESRESTPVLSPKM